LLATPGRFTAAFAARGLGALKAQNAAPALRDVVDKRQRDPAVVIEAMRASSGAKEISRENADAELFGTKDEGSGAAADTQPARPVGVAKAGYARPAAAGAKEKAAAETGARGFK